MNVLLCMIDWFCFAVYQLACFAGVADEEQFPVPLDLLAAWLCYPYPLAKGQAPHPTKSLPLDALAWLELMESIGIYDDSQLLTAALASPALSEGEERHL